MELTEITEENRAHGICSPVRPRLLSLKQAAFYLGRGEDSLRELIYFGVFPVIQLGSRSKMWLDMNDLDEWIMKNKQYLRDHG